MEVYLVGGAVRDELLGRPVTDRDWVVVGADPQQMLALGYTQVGRDFPVFLHPETHEEYALARTERKSGPGHRGFEVHAGAEVTLEQDLARRDLTINAIARTPQGQIIDPFNGERDLREQRLRHVSEAFSEDPLRVLRVARFAAQLPGFTVASETQTLLRHIVETGGLRELPAERVCQELSKLLEKQVPVAPFFQTLARIPALSDWFPEMQSQQPEVPAELVDVDLRYAALCWSLPADAVATLGRRLRVSTRRLRVSGQVARYGALLTNWQRADAELLCAALQALAAFKDPQWMLQAPAVIAACSGKDLAPLADAVTYLNRHVTTAELQARGLSGPALGQALAAARADALKQCQHQ
ncbi:MAG: multifunctional CCA tRNA nucleotidyl transferase/2'3'-cyclic phosphodiesterase/2'nucleotidase/phosphatase [Pseudomonadales bacterium]